MDDDSAGRVDTPPLQTISTFARSVGLSPSALRLYADQGLVVPAEVDGRTGYRYYTPEQQRRAVLVRRLRDADLPLADIRRVLDGPYELGAEILRRHAERSRTRAERTRTVLDDVAAALRPSGASSDEPVSATVDGAELAAAVEQVQHAAARPGDPAGLDGVLIDIASDEVAVAATDRYWMAWRRLPSTDGTGGTGRFLVASTAVRGLAAWARPQRRVELRASPAGPVVTAAGARFDLEVPDDRFPSYRQVYAGVPPASVRLIARRDEVIALVGEDGARSVTVQVPAGPAEGAVLLADGRPVVEAQVASPVPAGRPACQVSLSGGLFARALAATVGGHVRLDLAGELDPVVLTTPEQVAFTALVMPRRP